MRFSGTPGERKAAAVSEYSFADLILFWVSFGQVQSELTAFNSFIETFTYKPADMQIQVGDRIRITNPFISEVVTILRVDEEKAYYLMKDLFGEDKWLSIQRNHEFNFIPMVGVTIYTIIK